MDHALQMKEAIIHLFRMIFFASQKIIINSLAREIIFASQKKIHKVIGNEFIFVSQKKLLNHCTIKLCTGNSDFIT